jgi:DNA invertase Pin-like site-specific DNA recombinase
VSIPTICGKELPQITPAMPSEKNRFPFVPGKISVHRKLKPEQVQEIRYLLSEGLSKAKIARIFAISRSQIILLARGQIYKDIL